MRRLLVTTLYVLLLWQQPAWADVELTEQAAQVVDRVESAGYKISGIRRSWLGRIIITAVSDSHQREIVLNRKTGDVLSDRLFPFDQPVGDITRSSGQSDAGNRAEPRSPDAPGAPGAPAGPGGPDGPSGPDGPGGPPK